MLISYIYTFVFKNNGQLLVLGLTPNNSTTPLLTMWNYLHGYQWKNYNEPEIIKFLLFYIDLISKNIVTDGFVGGHSNLKLSKRRRWSRELPPHVKHMNEKDKHSVRKGKFATTLQLLQTFSNLVDSLGAFVSVLITIKSE